MQKKLLISFLLLLTNLSHAHDLSSLFLETEALRRAHVGIYIMELDTGKEAYSYNADQFFVAASLQKIPLSMVAISLLGEDYRFTTELGFEGVLEKDGILQGNLWVRGGGDPTLSLDVLSDWQREIEKQGISTITGKIIVDASCFETTMASPYWEFQDLGNYYGAGASSLTINNNLYKVTFKPGKNLGDPATVVKTDPEIPGLIIHNEVRTGPAGSGDQVCIYGSEYSPIQFYRGTVPLDEPTFTIKGAIPDPSEFCGALLSTKIRASQGVEVRRNKGSPAVLTKLVNQTSAPLRDIIKMMNLQSTNLYSEHLLKAIGLGMAEEGAKKITAFFAARNIPCQIKDGCGISRKNFFTPKGFSLLLREIRLSSSFQSIYDSFPEAGKSGTLLFFPKLPEATLKAKTGSMSHIFNLGGYITLASGKEYVFSIFCNNYVGSSQDLKKQVHHFLTSYLELASER